MGFVALDAGAADGGLGDSCIVPEDVEAGFLGEEGGGAGRNGGEVAEVEVETLELSAWRRAPGVSGLDGLDFSGDFAGRTGGDVDGAAFGVEDFDELKSDAGVSAGDDEDFTHEGGYVFLGESWTWWEELREISAHDGLDDE